MSRPNFIKKPTPTEQRALNRWIYLTGAGIIAIFTVISIFQVKQLMHFFTVKKDYLTFNDVQQSFDTSVAQQQTLKKDIEVLNTKTKAIKKITETNTKLVQLLKNIHKAIQPNRIETIHITNELFTVSFVSDSLDTLDQAVEQLAQEKSIKNVRLDSVKQTPEKSYLVTLKGTR